MDHRSTILECALHLFAKRGYDAVGVQEIVEAAGVTKPTLYHYFGNKRGVLEALVHEGFAPLFAQLDTIAPVQGDVPETLRRVIHRFFQFATLYPELYRLLLTMAVALPENEAFQITETIIVRQRTYFESLFQVFSAYNGNLRGREPIYAVTFQAIVHSNITLALQQKLALDSSVAQRAVQQFVFGIYA